MKARTLIVALALLLSAGAAHAQDSTLDRVQNLIATGRLTEARNTLADWERTHQRADAASYDDRARALFLSALLTTDAQAAEDAFLGVVLSYPSSSVAPEALLRLGQAHFSAGDTQRAIDYLERLRYDYPRAAERETGLLWLARAQLAAGNAATACGTAREGLLNATNQNVRTLIELERDRACAQSGGVAEQSRRTPVRPAAAPALPDLGVAVDPAPAGTPPLPDPVRTDSAPQQTTYIPPQREEAPATPEVRPPEPPSSGPEYAVQTAAFSERRSAETIAAELRAKGFDARVVTVPGSPYFRVRHGAFLTHRDAVAAALRIRDAGFATLVVNDVRLEQRL